MCYYIIMIDSSLEGLVLGKVNKWFKENSLLGVRK